MKTLLITDEEFYYTASDRSIRKYNAATKENTVFLESTFLVFNQI